MASMPLYREPAAFSPHIYLLIEAIGKTGENATIYVDDVIITQNEE